MWADYRQEWFAICHLHRTLAYRYIIFLVCRRHENMSPYTGGRVNSDHAWMLHVFHACNEPQALESHKNAATHCCVEHLNHMAMTYPSKDGLALAFWYRTPGTTASLFLAGNIRWLFVVSLALDTLLKWNLPECGTWITSLLVYSSQWLYWAWRPPFFSGRQKSHGLVTHLSYGAHWVMLHLTSSSWCWFSRSQMHFGSYVVPVTFRVEWLCVHIILVIWMVLWSSHNGGCRFVGDKDCDRVFDACC